MLAILPPRSISLKPNTAPPIVVYSDASWAPPAAPRVGWVAFDPLNPEPPVGYTTTVSDDLIRSLLPRETQICACEALAVPQGILVQGHQWRGRDLIWFIDNEAACSSMVRGGSTADDVSEVAALAHLLLLVFEIQVWFEWIDSDSNPSDGLSRDGLDDAWTLKQSWNLQQVPPLKWQDIQKVLASKIDPKLLCPFLTLG